MLNIEQLAKPSHPKTINEAVDILCNILSKEGRLALSSTARGDLIDHHFGLALPDGSNVFGQRSIPSSHDTDVP